ncbi:hypothetical protein COT95_01220 [Candidatus Falkowbacteria bacterium CG10_big_fil_rev_8_21_14_0_10_37_6]|uniref:Methyltransferase domain-containing protein n=1 Tax=Candidatus Falkowbacteria bacterium CG10_big_fil_rev_8_21_14_0_10_37_6 TaxID=1974563 RepID=A0A2H0V7E1_9BACT|nr:MAG: hypothetical protein COT95_01220 [Candidatus Falkowbacteria bacterium CG10_big_fil_rev_8_21_14_0_10_37_6]
MSFINTLPYISNPIEEFSDYKYVSWEKEIYPKFKGDTEPKEMLFFADILKKMGLRSILDLGVGGGIDLAGILQVLKKEKYQINSAEANEVDDEFIRQARHLFKSKNLDIPIHKANWIDLPNAEPEYTHLFDFAFLIGNSLTYIGGGTRDYTKKAQQSVVSKFAKLIRKNGYLFIDSRNYDYIRSLMNMPKEDVFEKFSFDHTVYYHGFQQKILLFPAYISETVVVLHYYDKSRKIWSKLDLYPIYQKDMLDILSVDFEVEKIYHDFKEGSKSKSLFVQYLAKRK